VEINISGQTKRCWPSNVEGLSRLGSTPPLYFFRYRLSRHLKLSCRSCIQGPAVGKHANPPEPTSHYRSLPHLYQWWNRQAISLAYRAAKGDAQNGQMTLFQWRCCEPYTSAPVCATPSIVFQSNVVALSG